MADIFISYTSSDRDWAFWIAHELNALGHTPHIDAWEISGGGNIAAWMETQHSTADHVLCVISERYLRAPYSSWERQAAQWAAATNRPNFALPVYIEPCEAPTLLAPIKCCDLYGIPEEDARARLAAFLEPATKSQRGQFPGSFKPSLGPTAAQSGVRFPGKAAENTALSNVPIRVPFHFLGRDNALADIRTALGRAEGRVAVTALHGLRGVRQDNTRSRVCRATSGRLPSDLVDQGANRAHDARRSSCARGAAGLGR